MYTLFYFLIAYVYIFWKLFSQRIQPCISNFREIFFLNFFIEEIHENRIFFGKFKKLRLPWMKSRKRPRMDMLDNLQNLTIGLLYKSHTRVKVRILLRPELQLFFGEMASKNCKWPPETVKLVKLSIFSTYLHHFFNLQGHFRPHQFRN